jgi:predicted DNA-binding transcriptional regulator AlpA
MAANDDRSERFDNLLNEYDVAKILNVSVATVRRWRLFGQGPRYIKIGASVRYRPEDVKAYLDSRPTGGGDEKSR